jgi:hypothetical protein
MNDLDGQGERASALFHALPRDFLAGGRGLDLAQDWAARAERSRASTGVWMPFYPFARSISEALFEVRRARRLVRGLEGAEEALERQRRGLERVADTQPGPAGRGRRISRLLVVAQDGSPRFLRSIERLRRQHEQRLELLGVEADAEELGAAIFGAGRSARAVLLDHKGAVVRLLDALVICDPVAQNEQADRGASGSSGCAGKKPG